MFELIKSIINGWELSYNIRIFNSIRCTYEQNKTLVKRSGTELPA